MSTNPPPQQTTPTTSTGIDLQTVSYCVSLLGTTIGIVLNLAPGLLFYEVFKKTKKYKEIPEAMLIFNTLCALFWACYWYRYGAAIAYYSALANTVISMVWNTVYLYFPFEGNKTYYMISLFILYDIILQLIYIFAIWIGNIEITGKLAMIVNIMQFAAPGQSILTVLKTGNYSLIPIVSTIVGLLVSMCWLTFGLIEGNLNCIIPNTMGLILSLLQVGVYYFFKMKGGNKKKGSKQEGEELIEVKE